MHKVLLSIVTAFIVLTFGAANAAVLTLPNVQLGVNADGSLDDVSANVGLNLVGVGDALIPGCPCESWGVNVGGQIGYTGPAIGTSNIFNDSFVTTATTAVSTTHLGTLPLSITHSFAPSAGSNMVFDATVTLTNTGATDFADVRYQRAMDWDVPPTQFNEFVTLGGWPASALLHSGDNGFAVPFIDPLTMVCPADSNFVNCGPSDHGATFVFDFGGLAAGQSTTFHIFYGADYSKEAALADLAANKAEVYSLGQSNTPDGPSLGTPGTFLFGFAGVGGTPLPPSGVPEPSSMLLLGTGLAVSGLFWRRARSR